VTISSSKVSRGVKAELTQIIKLKVVFMGGYN
jgi:hypothetical protein